MDTSDHTWNVICPPKNWRKPIPIKETDLALLDLVAKRLSLVLTRDEERKKIYLGTALTSDASIANGVRYPSGWSAEVVHDAGAEYKAVDPLAAAPLIRAFPDAQISKNFRLSEFRPGRHTYEYIRISPALVRALEEIRRACGATIERHLGLKRSVTASVRPPDYNREVGGVSNSTHIDGLAADIYCEGLQAEGVTSSSTDQLYDICEKVKPKR